MTTHYNASMQVIGESACARIIWTVDFLPDSVGPRIAVAMKAGTAAISTHFDAGRVR
jgi:hypothetical protein